ncbi:MAG: GNAT family N-acetyltransferase [Chromatiaceae bacterium]|jgi:GNAT superfamily N-acetyltransferase
MPFSLALGQVDSVEAPERIRKGMGFDRAYQGQGIGVGMLLDAIRRTLLIAGQAGIRALLTHSIDADADAFYRRFGFVSSPVREEQLLQLLKDARRIL